MMNNYIKGENPLGLAGPPKWWLLKLKDFDDSLVVMPSKMGHYYRLCQRRPPDPNVNIANSLSTDSDTKMLAQNGLVPVTTILSNARWDNPLMWEDLRQRAPHRVGGAEAFEQKLLAQERQKELDIAIKNDAIQTDVARDAWNYYLLKAGRKTAMWSPRTAARSTERRNTIPNKIFVPS